ncbi:MAG: hypothetical protein HY941_06595 [Gammaproteobacteria bacterium]|nr:hypothetical protein [Gammaproteobacteria bacterium]
MSGRRRLLHVHIAAFSGLLAWAMPALSTDIAVIVSRDAASQTLNAGTLHDIYLKKIFLDASGRKFIPLNLPADAPLREAFSQALFHQGSDELQDYWNQNYFHGIAPPYVLGSQDAVVRFVAQTPGAIGYVASCYVNPSVRQVLSLPLGVETSVDIKALCPPGTGEKAGGVE